jgi:hypothetical protein
VKWLTELFTPSLLPLAWIIKVMAVDAVLSELLSTINSLYQGKIQGILSIWSASSTDGMAQSLVFRVFTALWSSIHSVKNRESKSGYQGIGFPDTD